MQGRMFSQVNQNMYGSMSIQVHDEHIADSYTKIF